MNKALKQLLTEVAAGEVGPAVQAKARALLRKRPAPVKRIPALARASERKTAKREERRAKVAAIREAVAGKWGGRCAACFDILALGREPWHLHHTVGGGLRRARESEATCVPLCATCHRAIHAGDLALMQTLQGHASVLRLWSIFTALDKRIAKVREARSPRREESRRP